MDAAVAPGLGSAPEPSQFSRVANVVITPSKAFCGLDRRANWALPFILIVVISVAYSATVGWKVGFETVAQNQIAMNAQQADRMERMPADKRDDALRSFGKGYMVFAYAWPLVMLLMSLVIAGVLLGTFNFGMGASLKYKSVLAVVMYSWVPLLLKTVIAILALIAGMDSEGFNIQNPTPTNPGFFINFAEQPVLASFLSGLDVFQIWTLVVAAIGFTQISKLKKAHTLGAVFGWWLVTLLGGTAMAALFA